MKRIKSILLNSDFSGLRKRKKNVFDLNTNKNNKSLSKKSSFGIKQNTFFYFFSLFILIFGREQI
jgi:hypothetical protein